MSVHAIPTTVYATTLGTIRSVLNSKGLITTIHYEAAPYLVITTTFSDKVISFYWNGNTFAVRIGDAYVSGSTITNSLDILYFGLGLNFPMTLVISPNTVALVLKYAQSTNIVGVVFARRDNGNKLVFSYANVDSIYTVLKDTTSSQVGTATSMVPPFISANSKYYQHPFYFTLNGNAYADVPEISVVLKTQNPASSVLTEAFGNDLVINTGAYVNGVKGLLGMLIIKDGVI